MAAKMVAMVLLSLGFMASTVAAEGEHGHPCQVRSDSIASGAHSVAVQVGCHRLSQYWAQGRAARASECSPVQQAARILGPCPTISCIWAWMAQLWLRITSGPSVTPWWNLSSQCPLPLPPRASWIFPSPAVATLPLTSALSLSTVLSTPSV